MSDTWQQSWENPTTDLRPLQIIHSPDDKNLQELLTLLKNRGLGGVVCNVSWKDYLKSDSAWQRFGQLLETCRALGLRVWIYDEDGYPSGSAGGRVLEENPVYEALALAFDPSREDPFILRPAYEYTHASNNFYKLRRYPNLLDDRAGNCFIEKTHEKYYRRFAGEFGNLIEALFTDEPSLIAVNIGQLPQEAYSKVPVADPPDPTIKPLPMVPWVYDMPERYRERYGEDILPLRHSLFEGDSPKDRQVRSRFWELIGDLVCKRFFAALGDWCAAHGVASSGHCLHEENLVAKVPLEGNPLANLRQMHIPGMDLLTSDPSSVLRSGWLTALLPASAAMLNGTRRLMTEVSDFSATWDNRSPASLAWMQATAAWQAAFGITEFTLYYEIDKPSPDDYRAYNDYVGRLNAVLREAKPERSVLLYYPIKDLREEYHPVAEPLSVKSQTQKVQRITESFIRLGQSLVQHQVTFSLADHEALAQARIDNDRLQLGNGEFGAIVVPAGAELPTVPVLQSWLTEPDRLLQDAGGNDDSADRIADRLPRGIILDPPSDRIVIGRFVRDGQPIVIIVNVGESAYVGRIIVSGGQQWQRYDPANGEVTSLEESADGSVVCAFAGRSAVLLKLQTNETIDLRP